MADESAEAGTTPAAEPTLCPVCMTAELEPDTQCTLRCGHALCNRCLPLLHSPVCPICRQHIWQGNAAAPWLLASDTSPGSFEALFDMPAPPSTQASGASDTERDDTEDARIPVALVTQRELRHLFFRSS